MLEEFISKRGTMFGCGMATIPMGAGVVDIKGTFAALQKAGFAGHTTLEIAGEEAFLSSREYLKALGA